MIIFVKTFCNITKNYCFKHAKSKMTLEEAKKIYLTSEILLPVHDEDKFNDPVEELAEVNLNSNTADLVFNTVQRITEGMWHKIKDLTIPL